MSCNCLRSLRFGTLARHTCCRRSRVLRLFSFWHATATSCSSFWWRRVKSRLSSRSSEMNIDLCKTHLTSVSLILHNKAISVSRDLQRFKHNYHLGCLERTQSQFNHTSAHTSGAWRATTRLHHCRLFWSQPSVSPHRGRRWLAESLEFQWGRLSAKHEQHRWRCASGDIKAFLRWKQLSSLTAPIPKSSSIAECSGIARATVTSFVRPCASRTW